MFRTRMRPVRLTVNLEGAGEGQGTQVRGSQAWEQVSSCFIIRNVLEVKRVMRVKVEMGGVMFTVVGSYAPQEGCKKKRRRNSGVS